MSKLHPICTFSQCSSQICRVSQSCEHRCLILISTLITSPLNPWQCSSSLNLSLNPEQLPESITWSHEIWNTSLSTQNIVIHYSTITAIFTKLMRVLVWDSHVFMCEETLQPNCYQESCQVMQTVHLHYDVITLWSEHLLTYFEIQALDIRHWKGHPCDAHTNSYQSSYNYMSKVTQILVQVHKNAYPRSYKYLSSCSRG